MLMNLVQLSICDFRPLEMKEATLTEEERNAWMWSLFFCFVIPEFFTWFRASRICFFRNWKRPPFLDFLIIVLFDTFHVVGIATLVYAVLPYLEV